MTDLALKDKTILVTGADGFLGTNLCAALETAGAYVMATDTYPRQPDTMSLDISCAFDVDDYVVSLIDRGIYLDGVVNNAAVSFKGESISDEDFANTMSVNLQGTYNCITKFHQLMQVGGSMVNIASIFGSLSPDFRVYDSDPYQYNSSAYGATKAGILQMTRYYAAHFATTQPTIRVNAVSPGGIWQQHNEDFNDRYSERVPMGRMANVEEIVGPILFLLSPMSSYITGQNLMVDGGLSVW